MTSSDERPPNFRRRLFWLAALLVVLLAIYSAGWFYLAGRVKSEVDKAVAALNGSGIEAGCAILAVSGYPLSFVVSCDNLAYQDDTRNIAASAGSFNAVAQYHATSFAGRRPSGATENLGTWHGAAVDRLGQLAGQRETVLAMAPARFAGGRGSVRPDLSGGRNRPGLSCSAPGRRRRNCVRTARTSTIRQFRRSEIDPTRSPDACCRRARRQRRRDVEKRLGAGEDAEKACAARRSTSASSICRREPRASPCPGRFRSGPDGLIDADLTIRIKDPRAVATILGTAIPEQKNAIDRMKYTENLMDDAIGSQSPIT